MFPILTIGFGIWSVSSERRVPKPPARMTTCIEIPSKASLVSTVNQQDVKDTMHFLITGHTGFKGSWLSLLLRERGHQVSGIALNHDVNSLYDTTSMSELLKRDIRCDVRHLDKLQENFIAVNPDVVIHLAAQALVRESYKDPITTFDTNVLGTINVLKSSQKIKGLKAQLIITTDKVYKLSLIHI